MLAGLGHGIPEEAPEAMLKALLDLLKG
ncbi:hypothetical protein EMIT0P294_170031 [Pseudomonas sp. IT-P294]